MLPRDRDSRLSSDDIKIFLSTIYVLSTAFWTQWTPWGSCSVTCGGGVQTSERVCSDPDGTGGSCEGQETNKTQQCDSGLCRKFSKQLQVIK